MRAVNFVVDGVEIEPDKEEQINSNNYWNKITVCKIDNQVVVVDRTSWTKTQTGSVGLYNIDALGYPV